MGIPDNLLLIEEQSQGTRSSVINTIRALKCMETQPSTVLFITPHMFPKRVLMLWQHYSQGMDFLSVGTFVIQRDDEPAIQPDDPKIESIRRKDLIREIAKTFVTAALLKSGIW